MERFYPCRYQCGRSFNRVRQRSAHEHRKHGATARKGETPGEDAESLVLSQDPMYAKTPNEARCEMKVKVPLEYHVKLRGLKLLNNQAISDSVQEALKRYFASMEANKNE